MATDWTARYPAIAAAAAVRHEQVLDACQHGPKFGRNHGLPRKNLRTKYCVKRSDSMPKLNRAHGGRRKVDRRGHETTTRRATVCGKRSDSMRSSIEPTAGVEK
jgi:hypothetical protein